MVGVPIPTLPLDAERNHHASLHLTDLPPPDAPGRRRRPRPRPRPLRLRRRHRQVLATPPTPSKPLTDLRIMVPNSAGRRLRHHRAHGGQGHGGRQDHQRHRGLQPRGRRRHGRPGPHGQREGQRRPDDADGPRRGRRVVHQQVEVHAGRDHPDRQADRGVRRGDGAQGLARSRTSTTSSTPGRRTPARSASAAAPRPVAPTTCSRCSWPRPWASTPSRCASSPTTVVATCSRRCSATRSTSPPPGSASSRTRSPTATSASWRPAATRRSRASTPRR